MDSIKNKIFQPDFDVNDKEQFMLGRAEGIGLKRGLDKNKALPNRKFRQAAIAGMERQQEALAAMPESDEKNLLMEAWTPIGPAPIPNGQVEGLEDTPVSGRVTAIAVHPTNPNIVYVGTAQGGLYRTTNGGTNWTPLMDGAMSLTIGAVAIAPSQPETVYVGTGEGNFSLDSFFGVGVYRIDNAGSASPAVVGPLNKDAANNDVFTGRAISKIEVSFTNPATIFVATTSGVGGISGSSRGGLPPRGIYRSTNATGVNSTPIFKQIGECRITGCLDLNVRDIALQRFLPNFMAACVNDSAIGGTYLTNDVLNQFTPTFSYSHQIPGNSSTSNCELAVAQTPDQFFPKLIYAATGTGGGGGVHLATNDATWTTLTNNSFCSGQCFYDIAIAVDPTNSNRVYLGGNPNLTFGISNAGVNAFTASDDGVHTDTHVIAIAPSQPATIYLGTDGGMYKSTDRAATWTSHNNSQFSATQFQSIAVHPTDVNFTIGGTQDNGANFYQPQGAWLRVDGGDGGQTVIDQNATNTTNVRMYHTYFNRVDTDGVGADVTQIGYATVATTTQAINGSWTFRGCRTAGATTNGILCSGAVNFYAPLARGPGNPNTIYFGTERLYRSNDTGLNHQPVSQILAAGVPISAIGISPQNDNVRIVGQNNGGIWGTTNCGANLRNLDAGGVVPDFYIARAVIDPNNANTAYVTLSVFGMVNIWKRQISITPRRPGRRSVSAAFHRTEFRSAHFWLTRQTPTLFMPEPTSEFPFQQTEGQAGRLWEPACRALRFSIWQSRATASCVSLRTDAECGK